MVWSVALAVALATVSKGDDSLTDSNITPLTRHHIRSRGVWARSTELAGHDSMKHLCLRSAKIPGPRLAAPSITTGELSCSASRTTILSCSAYLYPGVAEIAAALKQNRAINKLDLSANRITDGGALQLG